MTRVISTKLAAPDLNAYVQPRARLLSGLLSALERKRAVLVQAPAGFGKSTLLAQLAGVRPKATLWYSFDAFDTLSTVLRHLSQAIQQRGDALEDDLTPLDFLGWLCEQKDELVLIFDDCHLAADREIDSFLELLCQRVPKNARVVLSSRREPTFSLGRLRVNDDLYEMTAEELRFELEEIRSLLSTVSLPGNGEAAQRLHRLTEGWPASVLLVAQAAQRGQKIATPEGLDLAPESLMDYLLREVFLAYPPAEQTALLSISLLDRFTPELCAHICPGPSPWQLSDSWFLVALDSAAKWYRLHHLFAAFLRERAQRDLDDPTRARIHALASLWFERQGLHDESIQHGMLGKQWGRTGRLLRDGKNLAAVLNLYKNSKQWFQTFPETEMDKVLFSRLGVVFWGGMRFRDAMRAYEKGLGSGDEASEFLSRSGLAQVNESLGLYQKREYWLARALEAMPLKPSQTRTTGLFVLAATEACIGHPSRAEELVAMGDAEALADELPLLCDKVLAFTRLVQGRLAEARRRVLATIERCQNLEQEPREAASWALLACCCYELGDLEQAEASMQRYLIADVPYSAPLHRLFVPVHVKVLRAQGRVAEMEEVLADYLREGGDSSPEVAAQAVRAHVETGEFEQAKRLLALHDVDLETSSYEYRFQSVYTAWIAYWLAAECPQGRGRITEWLAVLEAEALSHGRLRELLEAKLLRAQYLLALGKHGAATDQIEEALALGRPWEFVAPFMEQPVEVRRLCTQLDPGLLKSGGQWGHLTTLSAREREILELMGRGATNRDIAEKCFLSLNTVKWHNQKMYKKLGVTGRAEALAMLKQG